MAQSQTHKQDNKHGGGHDAAEGKKGVAQETVGSGKEHDPNNFANNPDRAAAAGRKGGHPSLEHAKPPQCCDSLCSPWPRRTRSSSKHSFPI